VPGLSPDQYALAERLEGVFMPYAHEQRLDVIKRNGRFAHYTSAENALNIINGREIWLRNTVLMSDYSEVMHGHQHLVKFFSNPDRKAEFIAALDECAHGGAMGESW
jgi:hypothetical protein